MPPLSARSPRRSRTPLLLGARRDTEAVCEVARAARGVRRLLGAFGARGNGDVGCVLSEAERLHGKSPGPVASVAEKAAQGPSVGAGVSRCCWAAFSRSRRARRSTWNVCQRLFHSSGVTWWFTYWRHLSSIRSTTLEAFSMASRPERSPHSHGHGMGYSVDVPRTWDHCAGPCAPKPSAPAACRTLSPPSSTTTSTPSAWPRWATRSLGRWSGLGSRWAHSDGRWRSRRTAIPSTRSSRSIGSSPHRG